jgi:hypothetical protein
MYWTTICTAEKSNIFLHDINYKYGVDQSQAIHLIVKLSIYASAFKTTRQLTKALNTAEATVIDRDKIDRSLFGCHFWLFSTTTSIKSTINKLGILGFHHQPNEPHAGPRKRQCRNNKFIWVAYKNSRHSHRKITFLCSCETTRSSQFFNQPSSLAREGVM